MKPTLFAVCLIAIAACAGAPPPDQPATSSDTAELGNACTIQCNTASQQCNAVCDRNPRPNCEQNCDTRLTNCMQACGCPFSQDTFQTTFDHLEGGNITTCVGTGFNGTRYRLYGVFSRIDDIRQTLQCDGTTTSAVVSSTVALTGNCYGAIPPGVPCRPATTDPANIIVCTN